jgi:hypothetical protein
MLLLSACSSQSIDDYAAREPAFALEEFFRGKLTAHGVLYDFRGRVTRTFVADIQAYEEDGATVLDEDFVFSDGEKQKRVWRIRPDDEPGRYTGTAGDVVGPATLQVAGNALNLKYTLEVQFRGDTMELGVDDWMYRVSDNVVINESKLRKWGLPVGRVLLTIIREP